MVTTKNLDYGQKRTLAGLIDASCPNCVNRIKFYELEKRIGLVASVSYLRGLANANQNTVDLIESFLGNLNVVESQ